MAIQKIQKMSADYLAGAYNSDGTLLIAMTKDMALKPEIRLSSKTNTNVLGEVQKFLTANNITSGFMPAGIGVNGRAPALRVQGRLQIVRLMDLLKNSQSTNVTSPFIGVKYRDFLIFEKLFVKPPKGLTIEEKIDIKKTLHKANYSEPDLQTNDSADRSTIETKFGIPLGGSKNAAQTLIQQIDSEYELSQKNTLDAMQNNTLVINDNFLVGFIDCDGSYTCTFQFRDARPLNYTKKSIDFSSNCSVTVEIRATIINDLFVYHFKFSQVSRQFSPNQTNPTSEQMYFRKEQDVKNLINWAKNNPPLGDHRLKQLELLIEIYRLKDLNLLKGLQNQATVEKLFADIYAVKNPGVGRQLTLSEALAKVPNYLN